MRAALYQMHIAYEDKESNYRKAENKIREAASYDTDLFLMPEMSFTGFSMDTDLTGEEASDILRCAVVDRIAGWAREYHMYIGFGWVKRDAFHAEGEKRRWSENHYTIVDRTGSVISDYIKIHPFSYGGEARAFRKGDHLSFCEIEGIPVSTFICYDLRFPELFRKACDRAELMIVPANWPDDREEVWKTLIRARAMENLCYVAAINEVGKSGKLHYSGDSGVFNPWGEELPLINPDTAPDGVQEGLLIYDIPHDASKFRQRFPALRDRRPELYEML